MQTADIPSLMLYNPEHAMQLKEKPTKQMLEQANNLNRDLANDEATQRVVRELVSNF